MNNIMNIMQMYRQLRTDPAKLLSQRFNIPSSVNINDPNSIIQHLLNTQQIQQNQVNQLMGMRNNPMIQQLLHTKF